MTNYWKTRFIGLMLVIQALFILPELNAAEVKGLYQAKVPVANQTREQRLEVYPDALAQVVVKLTGDQAVADLAELSGLMKRARTLVQQFHYEELAPDSEALIEEGFTRLLVVSFDDQAITQALIEANVPLWGHTRPEVLLWLAIEDRETRYILAANASAELETYLANHAKVRGLPLILPLVDLEDQAQLSFADVWGDFRPNLVQASQRYGVKAILVGRLIRSSRGMWQARWSLHYNNDVTTPSEYWHAEVNLQQEALIVGVDGAADRIAQRYAQLYSIGSADSVGIKIKGVNDLASYARSMKYLESLDIVTDVNVVTVRADEVQFLLDIRGDSRGLEQAIALGGTLVQIGDEDALLIENGTASTRAFVYQLLP